MTHRNTVEFEVSAEYALFTGPATVTGGEKTTYREPTYEAIKGVLQSIYWKPVFIWVVDRVRIMNPVRMESKGVLAPKYQGGNSRLHIHTYLKDCRYQVQAHFIWNLNRPELAEDRNENKHWAIAKRMIKKGGRRDIFLGSRECQAYVRPCAFGEGEGAFDGSGKASLGRVHHGYTYADEAYSDRTRGWLCERTWAAVIDDGIIDFIPPWECAHRRIRKMGIKPFSRELGNYTFENAEAGAEGGTA